MRVLQPLIGQFCKLWCSVEGVTSCPHQANLVGMECDSLFTIHSAQWKPKDYFFCTYFGLPEALLLIRNGKHNYVIMLLQCLFGYCFVLLGNKAWNLCKHRRKLWHHALRIKRKWKNDSTKLLHRYNKNWLGKHSRHNHRPAMTLSLETTLVSVLK